ncbi:hypothetical protein [Dysgonomonas sp. 520]|uniref:hypothetical protein n=1 Tax=Dysgonomonas sp. 520 TaxID=2302931 RepID=UPI0013D54DC5|nr:hypothetical protein [Dysgonomonas sp. 520]NDW10391.1 hypothetical protein [Dysgonomonas sp. 520]
MTVITELELKKNVSKYLDIAQNEKIVITRGKNRFELVTKQSLISEEDIADAMTVDEAKRIIEPRIREIFRK